MSTRTVRSDIERLRDLGYPVHATRGAVGGYRLGAGAALPPLLLDDEEAVAVAVGLRTAAGGASTGIEETSLRALAKLEQVLPARLRRRVNALQASTRAGARTTAPAPTVDPAVLTVLAGACRDRERLRFDYRGHDGTVGRRHVEPYRLVSWGRRWYLVAWDPDRDDWRTFRVDRIDRRVTPSGPASPHGTLPEGGDLAATSRGGCPRPPGATAPGSGSTRRPRRSAGGSTPAAGMVETVDERTCLLDTGADTLETLAVYLGMLGADFEVGAPPELVEHLRDLADRYRRATT